MTIFTHTPYFAPRTVTMQEIAKWCEVADVHTMPVFSHYKEIAQSLDSSGL